ncbi:MAG TPA: hypothetical protein VGB17_00845 [Pyrinomonadaceae bacterium]
MGRKGRVFRLSLLCLLLLVLAGAAEAQNAADGADEEFGPNVRAYLGYLRNEQEVVDDRASRHEISRAYYLRNSNRIRALRQMAIRIARESHNDYLPELEAAARDELGNLFEMPPRPESLQVGEVFNNTFRFLGTVRTRETFFIFSRLDPYEQAELIEKSRPGASRATEQPSAQTGPAEPAAAGHNSAVTGRPRRVSAP